MIFKYCDRKKLKKMMQNVFGCLVYPMFLLYLLLGTFGDKDEVFWSFSQFLSLFPGKTGSYLRNGFFRRTMTRCHPESTIQFGTIFSQRDTEIGAHVYIGPNCNIGRSRIEDYCTLGSNVHIMSGKKQHFFDDPKRPIKDQGGRFEKVSIGEDAWIGNGALIMADVGRKCIVGAGSVVVEPVSDHSIVAGNPAKRIGRRESADALRE